MTNKKIHTLAPSMTWIKILRTTNPKIHKIFDIKYHGAAGWPSANRAAFGISEFGFKIWSDPDTVFKFWSDPVFKTWSDPDPV